MRHYGFNFQWMFSKRDAAHTPSAPDLKALDFMADHGFNFARIPTDYRFWTAGTEYTTPDETVFTFFDRYLEACTARGIHMSLNLHRAPGYCINRNDLETHDLWSDKEAQDGFVFLWETFARRYQGRPGTELSFDLLNEPPGEKSKPPHSPFFTRDVHQAVMRRTVAAIRAIDPDRPIVLNGINGGGVAIPELADLGQDNVVHSGRGYAPFPLTHYKAEWTSQADLPVPTWPLTASDGRIWDREALREYYTPWREVESQCVAVHIGEFGCYNKTPDATALDWFEDLLGIYHDYSWGYSLWGFEGAFGIINHNRPGAVFEDYKGYRTDRRLLDLLIQNRAV